MPGARRARGRGGDCRAVLGLVSNDSETFGGVPVIVQSTESGDGFPTARISRPPSPQKQKVVILNSACNPTGALYSRTLLGKILAAAQKRGIIVISDEVYSGLVYEGAFVSCGVFPNIATP